MVRAEGIEPSPQAWEAHVLPLNYARSIEGQENEVLVATLAIRISRVSRARGDRAYGFNS